jgi:hypothetical protein
LKPTSSCRPPIGNEARPNDSFEFHDETVKLVRLRFTYGIGLLKMLNSIAYSITKKKQRQTKKETTVVNRLIRPKDRPGHSVGLHSPLLPYLTGRHALIEEGSRFTIYIVSRLRGFKRSYIIFVRSEVPLLTP